MLERVSRVPESSRPFMQGDPINLIDWRAFARTDQLIVRQQRDEASGLIDIIIDDRKTMHWPVATNDVSIPSKSEIAWRLGFWLAHTHLSLGDMVAVHLRRSTQDDALRWDPRSPADVIEAFRTLKDAVKSSETGSLNVVSPGFFRDARRRQSRSDVIWCLSDNLENLSIEDMSHLTRSFVMVQILSSRELGLEWMDDDTCYVERTPLRKDYLGTQLKSSSHYHQQLTNWKKDLEKKVVQIGGKYISVTEETKAGSFFHFFVTEGCR